MTIEEIYTMHNAWLALKISLAFLAISIIIMIFDMISRSKIVDPAKKTVGERVRHFTRSHKEIFGEFYLLPHGMRLKMEKHIIEKLLLYEKLLSD